MREILFRGKRLDNEEWVEGDLHKNSDFTKAHIHPIGERLRSFDIFPETVCQYIGYLDYHKNKIFDGDIIEFTLGNKYKERYLIWFHGEISSIVEINLDGIRFNGNNYWNSKYPKTNWSEFCLMLQNIYGDFTDIKVVGNIHDNSELIKWKKEYIKEE